MMAEGGLGGWESSGGDSREYSYVNSLGKWKLGLIVVQVLIIIAVMIQCVVYYPMLKDQVPAHFDLYGKHPYPLLFSA